jgi:hypothetical protein
MMNTQVALSPNWNAILSGGLGIVAILFVVAYLAGVKAPLITSDRAAFLALTALGFGMCTLGMGSITTQLGWTHPINIIGSVLGVLIILLVIGVLSGWNLPLITDDRAAFIAVAAIGFAKWALGLASRTLFNI